MNKMTSKAPLAGLALGLIIASSVSAQAWRSLGPAPIDNVQFAGRVASIAVSAEKPDRYYAAGASGGVWITKNGGHTWRPVTDNLPTLAMGAIALDPSNERVIYAGSGESHNAYHSLYGLGMYKSTNGGHSWRVLAPEVFSGRTISRIVVSPTGTVWATVARAGGNLGEREGAKLHPDRQATLGLFRSDDGGATWSVVSTGVPQINATDVDLDPLNPNRLFVCYGEPYGDFTNGCYRSDDGGATFQRVVATGFLGRTELALAPSNPDRLYVVIIRSGFPLNFGGFTTFGGATFGVQRSDDGGLTFNSTAPTGNFHGFQGNYNSAIVVHPTDPDTVVIGGVAMLRSTDAGATWQTITPPHSDIHDLHFDAAGRLVAATDGGVYRSDDVGDTWEARNRQLGTVQFYPGLSVHPTDPGILVGGTQDNGSTRRLGHGQGWEFLLTGDGGYSLFHPQDPDQFFVQYQGAGNLFLSDGISMLFRGEGIDIFDATAFQAPIQVDPNNSQRMLYATQRIYESTDFGVSWTAISGDLTASDPLTEFFAIRSFAIAPSNSQTVYATTNNQRLLVSTDGGSNWTLLRTDVYGWPRIMRQIAVDPLDDAVAYVAIGQFGGEKVIRTTDRGQTWVSMGAGLPDVPVNTVAVVRGHGHGHGHGNGNGHGNGHGGGRMIFAGTDRGVFLTRDEGATWRPFGRRLPKAPVVDLVIDDHGRLVAGTLGRGVWVARLPH